MPTIDQYKSSSAAKRSRKEQLHQRLGYRASGLIAKRELREHYRRINKNSVTKEDNHKTYAPL